MNSEVTTKVSVAGWFVPAALILLSAIPIIAGAFRVTELGSGADVTPDNARFFASPLPVVLHIVSVSVYSILGAFQFAPGFRRRRPGWHRAAGRLLIPSGLIAALSGLWMTQFYPWPEYDGEILYSLRLLFGSAMFVFILLSTNAIRRRDFARHGAWMIRAYAIGLGAGTQVLTHLPLLLFPALLGEPTRALAMGAGWVINLAVAEWVIRKRLGRPALTVSAVVPRLPQTSLSLYRKGRKTWRTIGSTLQSVPHGGRGFYTCSSSRSGFSAGCTFLRCSSPVTWQRR